MTREECPKEYFEHLTEVVRSVFNAETELHNRRVLTEETCSKMSVDEYCEKVAEELISRTSVEELTNIN